MKLKRTKCQQLGHLGRHECSKEEELKTETYAIDLSNNDLNV